MLILAAGLLQAGPYDWHALPFGGAGFVCGVITCPSQKGVIFARTDVGGAYRWNPQDQSWTQLLDWVAENEKGYLGVESLAVDPSAPKRVYLLAGTAYWDHGKSAILRSEDSGATFEVIDTTAQFKAHGNGMGRQNGERLAVDPHNGKILLVGTRRDGMFRSSDYGRTWAAVASFPVKTTGNDNGICFVLFDPRSGQKGQATPVIYAGVSTKGQNVFISKDAGKTWQPIPGLPADLMPQRASLASDGTLYLTYGSEAGPWNTQKGGVWKLDTRTLKSVAITPAGYETRPFGGITVSAGDPKRIACSTINTWLDQRRIRGQVLSQHERRRNMAGSRREKGQRGSALAHPGLRDPLGRLHRVRSVRSPGAIRHVRQRRLPDEEHGLRSDLDFHSRRPRGNRASRHGLPRGRASPDSRRGLRRVLVHEHLRLR